MMRARFLTAATLALACTLLIGGAAGQAPAQQTAEKPAAVDGKKLAKKSKKPAKRSKKTAPSKKLKKAGSTRKLHSRQMRAAAC
jgi:hypothetical protein